MRCSSLCEVRSNIDRIDDEIVKLIAERGTYVSQAALFKKNEDSVKAPRRVETVIAKVRQRAEKYGINPQIVEAVYREMIFCFVNMELIEFNRK